MNTFDLGNGNIVYDVFRCRHYYIGLVSPYWCRPEVLGLVAPHYCAPTRDGRGLLIEGRKTEWFALPDSRQFTLSLLAKIPGPQRNRPKLTVSLAGHDIQVRRLQPTVRRLAMVTMVRYDAPYLAEWIDHHADLGFQHFYIYNHHDNSEISEIVRSYPPHFITEISWSGAYEADTAWAEPFLSVNSHCYTQCPQMMHAALKYGDHWEWMGFFDADEFLCPMTDASLHDILDKAEQGEYCERPYERTAALQIKGKWFGTSGHRQLQQGSVLDNYTRCEAGHTCGYKCFVQPHTVTGTAIHYWDVTGQTSRVPDNVLRFNHYRAISAHKRRVGRKFDADWTNEQVDTRLCRKERA